MGRGRGVMEYICGRLGGGERCCWQVGNCIRDVDVLASACGMDGCHVLGVVINIDMVCVQGPRHVRWMQCQLF